MIRVKLYNSLTNQKEEFVSLEKDRVSMYVCGITPNNATHLGHAFTYVSFDMLIRYLKCQGYEVNYLQNATDINDSDDVIKQAIETGKTWEEVANFWIKHFQHNMKLLNVLPPTKYVLATSAIKQIIEMNKVLLEKGFAYEKSGNIYFDSQKFPSYGSLSKFTEEQMLLISKERGNNPDDPLKKNSLDFVLWLAADKKPFWDSPWSPPAGGGRPGWHIECSAMIYEYLGSQIDIHGGGRDLIFPHHESEIAQSETFTGKKPYVKTWMHTAMVLYEGEKMSKSLGNLVLVEDLLKKYSPEALRFLILSHHYRDPWEFREEELAPAETQIAKLKEIAKNATKKDVNPCYKDFQEFMDDDLGTPFALMWLLRLAKEYKTASVPRQEEIANATLHALHILGFAK